MFYIRFQEMGNTVGTRSVSANDIGGYGERKKNLNDMLKIFPADVRFEDLTAVIVKGSIFWDITPCRI
jgi:hypothetical protein